jgi:predicted enzyme related to lactoylglutathione lyase
MKRVTGIGGVFFKAKSDQKELNQWYEKHLGIDYAGSGGYPFWSWRAFENPDKEGATVWSVFSNASDYFGNPEQQFMINFRVENLSELLEVLRSEGVQIAGEIQDFPYGRFAWILDPDGNRIELWEPGDVSGFTGGMAAE